MTIKDKRAIKALEVGKIYFFEGSTGKVKARLGGKRLSDGRLSLFIDYYLGYAKEFDREKQQEVIKHTRVRKSLKKYIIINPLTEDEARINEDNFNFASTELVKERLDISGNDDSTEIIARLKKKDFHEFYNDWIKTYSKKDKRVVELAYNRFVKFLDDTTEYKRFAVRLYPKDFTRDMMFAFTDYLKMISTGEGAKTSFARFKKILRRFALSGCFDCNEVLTKEDGTSITIETDERAILKDVLSPEEIVKMEETHYLNENKEVRKAFLWSLNTGMRWCDVKEMKFGDFDFGNNVLNFIQKKTADTSSKSRVTLFLTDSMRELLGEQPEKRGKDELVFNLPSHTMCLKALRKWTEVARIDKHITFHCARHTYGTLLASAVAQRGLSIRVVQDMLGHSNLRYTEKYTRVLDEQRRKAQDSLSQIMRHDIENSKGEGKA